MPRKRDHARPAVAQRSESPPARASLKIRMPLRPTGEVRYSNHILATFNGTDFVVTFAQVIHPAIVDDADWQVVLTEGHLDAEVISRIVVPAQKFAEFVDSAGELVERIRKSGVLPSPSIEEA